MNYLLWDSLRENICDSVNLNTTCRAVGIGLTCTAIGFESQLLKE